MILNPSGKPASQHVIPMHARHVRGLCDGQYYALHPSMFKDLQLELVCDHCRAAGLLGEIQTTLLEGKLDFRCAHAHGFIRTDRKSDFSSLLHTLGWTLSCSICGEEAAGDNDAAAPTLDVTCACTIRRLVNPVAQEGTA